MMIMFSRSNLGYIFILYFILTIFLFKANADKNNSFVKQKKHFNVLSYGAIQNGKDDNSQVFLKAWEDACKWKGVSVILIPKGGSYMLNSVTFKGPCESYRIVFQIKGMLKATTYPSYFFRDTWIGFQYVNNLVVKGGGVLDGQGESAWKYNDCFTNPNCKALPVTLRFDFVTNSKVENLRSINSKSAHFTLFASQYVSISKVRLIAPSESLNTDGIRIGNSSNINIYDSIIGTGDDCIGVISDSRDIDVTRVVCGPGHGISIGSLGNKFEEEYVMGVNVRNCTFNSTDNGVRIKTRPSLFRGMVSNIKFSDILMENVRNPIVIDQKYCPGYSCSTEVEGNGEGIKDVTYENIWGTSTSEVAISFDCSQSVPCENVKTVNIDLAYHAPNRTTISVCSNVHGISYGKQQPSSCL